jgi:hypothetical protein
MGLSLTPLLMHSEYVSAEARNALRLAHSAPPEQRTQALEAAARLLFREADVSCRDVREIVGLDSASCK